MFSNAAFIGPDSTVQCRSIKEILENPVDDARVVLKGKILEKVKHEKYLFADSTGKILIDIDDKRLRHIDVSPKNTIEIRGEIDVNRWFSGESQIEIDVKFVRIIK